MISVMAFTRSCSPTHGNSYSRMLVIKKHWWRSRETAAYLNTTFNEEAFEAFYTCLDKGYQVFLPDIKCSVPLVQRSKLAQHTSLPGMTPPQKPTSVKHCPSAAVRLLSRFSTVVVGGIELRGMSMTVVTPPERAARVPVRKPSQSVRPGSFRWTCAL